MLQLFRIHQLGNRVQGIRLPVCVLCHGGNIRFPDPAQLLRDAHAAVQFPDRRNEFLRAGFGGVPGFRHPGVVWIGNLNFDGTDLDIFSVRETVVDKTGTVRLFPATSAMVTAPNCGHMMYGRIDQIEDDNEYHSFAMQRVPKFVVDKDKDIRKLRLGARPLSAPKNKAPWMYAANVVGT